MSAGQTHYADDATLSRLRELEQENERLRALLRESLTEWIRCTTKCEHKSCALYKRIRAALREGK